MGAFGLNASILDAANLSWKLGLAAKGKAKTNILLPTYNGERRQHAVRVIEVSGTYLRFVCGSDLYVPDLRNIEALNKQTPNGDISYVTDGNRSDSHATNGGKSNGQQTNGHSTNGHSTNGHSINGHSTNGHSTNGNSANGNSTNGQGGNGDFYKDNSPAKRLNGDQPKEDQRKADLEFLATFFKNNGQFLLGVDCPYGPSVIRPQFTDSVTHPVSVKAGVRAPNPRVCFATGETGYLYDKLAGAARFHIVVFGSSLSGQRVLSNLHSFVDAIRDPKGFYRRFGGVDMFNIVLVTKLLPFELDTVSASARELIDLLRDEGAQVVFDDRAPDEDAHTTWGANHATGGVAVIRPDLWVATTAFPDEMAMVKDYFAGFLLG